MERMNLDRITVRSAGEIFRRVGEVDEGVESFVHPWIKSLVGADEHREPLGPELVGDHPLLILARRTIWREGQHRVLHSLDRTFDCGRVRPWVRVPLLAVIL